MRQFTESMKAKVLTMLATEGLNIALYFHFREFEEEFAWEIQRFFGNGALKASKNDGMKLVRGNRTRRGSKVYHFELLRFALDRRGDSYSWGISKMKPRPSLDPSEMIPQALRNQLSEAPVDENRVLTLDFELAGLERMFHVTYTRIRDDMIIGKMWDVSDGHDQEELPPENVDIRFAHPWQKQLDHSYTELFLYMEGNPGLRAEIFSRFYLLQKPLIQQEQALGKNSVDSM